MGVTYIPFEPELHGGRKLFEVKPRDDGKRVVYEVVPAEVGEGEAGESPWYYVVEGGEGEKGGPGSGHYGHSGVLGKRGGSSPSTGFPSDILPSHKKLEKKLVTRKTELGVGFDSEGNVTLRKSGTATSIKYTKDEAELLRGAAVHYHNHPSHEQAPSVSFSPDDLEITALLDIGEARVISNGHRYRIKGNPESLRKMATEGSSLAEPILRKARYYSRARNYEKARGAAEEYNDWHSRWKGLAEKHDVLYVQEVLDEIE